MDASLLMLRRKWLVIYFEVCGLTSGIRLLGVPCLFSTVGASLLMLLDGK